MRAHPPACDDVEVHLCGGGWAPLSHLLALVATDALVAQVRNVGSPKGAKAKADRLFSLVVRSRGACEACGERDYTKLQTAHIISRRFSATRCDESNALCACAKCHMFWTDHPVEFAKWVMAHVGPEAYQRLFSLIQKPQKVDWQAEAERLAARCKELGIETRRSA